MYSDDGVIVGEGDRKGTLVPHSGAYVHCMLCPLEDSLSLNSLIRARGGRTLHHGVWLTCSTWHPC